MAEICFFDVQSRIKPKPWDGRLICPRVVEHKFDGRRVTIVKGKTRVWNLERKQTSEIEDLSFVSEVRRALAWMPPMSAIDGELYVTNKRATEVVTAINARAENLRFQPFAVPWWDGRPQRHQTFEEQDALLTTALGFELPTRSFPLCKIPHKLEGDDAKQKLLHYCMVMQIEGLVFKTTPQAGWWKIKPVETIDCVVVGTKPGLGKHAGRHGALEVALRRNGEWITVASVGKGCDEQWRDLPGACVMFRVVEVSHEGVQAGGKLKFSSFVRWRDDKPMEDCTWDQIETAREG